MTTLYCPACGGTDPLAPEPGARRCPGVMACPGLVWPFEGLERISYGTVVVDPPWDLAELGRAAGKGPRAWRLGGSDRRPAASRAQYATLSVDELAALPVGDLVGDSGHLWLWCTNGVLAAGAHARLLDAWRFRPITVATWCKPGRNGMGQYLRGATEHAVLAVRGWGTVPEVPYPSTWWEGPRLRHSVKPSTFGYLVEHVSPGPYVELFARQQRLGWDSWGHGHEDGP